MGIGLAGKQSPRGSMQKPSYNAEQRFDYGLGDMGGESGEGGPQNDIRQLGQSMADAMERGLSFEQWCDENGVTPIQAEQNDLQRVWEVVIQEGRADPDPKIRSMFGD